MAGNTVSVGLQVTAEGLDKVVSQSKQFNNNMQGGANALKSSEQASRGAMSAYRKENQEYGVSRAVGAGTGASARDFAQQAQGLGGLVHLYATFAANIFAVSAAFTQLSKAADTKNMIDGMSQLSASSGRTLKTLAGQMKDVSDGALSLRDSMNATALASAGGMTNQQILKMTELAKKASSALGRDMSDSMDRMTKGIIKVQPELLDELGIMTRVIPAQQAYALSLGKSVDSLTDFEKKQAFANAVLKEAETKFGAINVDANPYSKLSASLADLATNGLMVVNTVLSPIAKFLAESPTALASAVTLLTGTLVKQAFPVLSNMKQLSRDMLSKETTKANLTSAETFAPLKQAHAELTAELGRMGENIINKSGEMDAKLLKMYKVKDKEKLPNIWKAVYDVPPDSVTDAQLNALSKKAEQINAQAAAKGRTSEKGEFYTNYVKQIKSAQVAIQDIAKAEAEADGIYLQRQSIRTAAGNAQATADKLNQIVRRDNIKLASVEVASMQGVVSGWKQMNAEIAKARSGPTVETRQVKNAKGELEDIKVGIPAMSAWGAGVTRMATGAALAVQGIMNLSNVIGIAGMVASAGLAVYEGMNWMFSKNAEQAKKFATALEQTTEASKVFNDTTKEIDKKIIKDPFEAYNIKNLQAISNAMLGIADAVTNLSKSFDEVRSTRSWWDSLKNSVTGIFGHSDAQQAAKTLAVSLESSIKNMPMGNARTAYINSLKTIFKFEGTDAKGLLSGLQNLSENELSKVLASVKALDVSQANQMATSIASATSAISSLDKLNSSYLTLKNSLSDNSPSTVFATNLVDAATKVHLAFQDPVNSLAVLQNLLKNSESMKFLPASTQKELKDAEAGISRLVDKQHNLDSEIAQREAKINQYQAEYNKAMEAGQTSNAEHIKPELDRLNTLLQATKQARDEVTNTLTSTTNNLAGIFNSTLETGSKLMTLSFETASKKAALEILGVSASRLQGPGSASVQNNLKSAEIELQKSQIVTMAQLIHTIEKDTLVREKQTLVDQAKTLNSNTDAVLVQRIGNSIAELDRRIKFRESTAPGKNINVSGIKAEFAGLSDKSREADLNYYKDILGIHTKLVELSGKQGALKLDTLFKERDAEQKSLERAQDANILRLKNDSDRLNALASYSSVYDTISKQEAQDAANKLQDAQHSKELAKAEFDIRTQALAIEKSGSAVSKEDAAKIMDDAFKTLQYTTEKHKAEKEARETSNVNDNIKREISLRKQLSDDYYAMQELINKSQDLEVSNYKSQLSYMENIGAVTKEYAIELQSIASIKEAQLQYDREMDSISKSLGASARDAAFKLQEQLAQLKKSDGSAEGDAAYTASVDRLTNATRIAMQAEVDRAAVASANAQKSLADKTAIITLEGQHKSIMEAQSDVMKQMTANTTSLAEAFGEVGSAIGTSIQKLIQMGNTITNNKDAEAAAQKQINELRLKAEDAYSKEDFQSARKFTGEAIKGEQDLAKLKKKNDIDEVRGAAETLGAFKNMFDKKSAAAKAFGAVEKMLHIASLGMQAVELANTIKNAASAIMAWSPAAALKGLTDLGWWAAPMIMATIASLSGGQGASINMAGLTAGDRQSTQGTGQKWGTNAAGEVAKVDTGGGVFGDSSAKSESIVKSLELMKDTSVEGITLQSRMVTLLESINQGINQAATSLYRIPGLMKGSAFGTTEGSSGGGGGFMSGLFGTSSTSTEITDSGIKFLGTFADMMDTQTAKVQQYEDVLRKSSSSGALWGLFGGSSSESLSRNITALGDKATTALVAVFKNTGDLFQEFGNRLGKTNSFISSTLQSLDLTQYETSLRGLKGEELQTALQSVISTIMDDAAQRLFPEFAKFKAFGEGMGETVSRVLDGSDKVHDALSSIGMSIKQLPETVADVPDALFQAVKDAENAVEAAKTSLATKAVGPTTRVYGEYGSSVGPDTTVETKNLADAQKDLLKATEALNTATGLSTTYNYDVTESLINMAGSLQTFLDRAKFFGENFLSPIERAKPIIAAFTNGFNNFSGASTTLATNLKAAGVSASMTTQQYASLVQGLDLTNTAQAEMYNWLMKMAPAFDAAKSSIEGIIGFTANDIASIISDGMLGKISGDQTGEKLADLVVGGIYNTVANSGAQQISQLFMDTIINPMVQAAITGGTATQIAAAVSTSAIEGIISAAENLAIAMQEIFKNPAIKNLISTLSTTLGKVGTLIGGTVKPYSYVSTTSSGSSGSGTTAVDKVAEEKAALEKQLEDLKTAALSESERLEKQRNALLSDTNKLIFDQIQAQIKLNKISEEKTSLEKQLEELKTAALTDAERLEKQRNALLSDTNKLIFDQIQAQIKLNKAAEEKTSLEKELDDLKTAALTEAQQLEKQRNALLSDTNKLIFDQIQAQKAINKATEEKTSLEKQLDDLKTAGLTEAQQIEKQRNALLSETNKLIFDQIQAQIKLNKAAEEKSSLEKQLDDLKTAGLTEAERVEKQRNALLSETNKLIFDQIQAQIKLNNVAEEKTSLEKQLDDLKTAGLTEAERVEKQRNALLSETNKLIFDQIQAQKLANKISEEKTSLEKQLDDLKTAGLTEAEQLEKQRNALLSETNKLIFDQIQAQKLANKISEEKTSLEKQLDDLKTAGLTEAEQLEKQRNALLSETNKLIFDQIQAQKATNKAAEEKKSLEAQLADALDAGKGVVGASTAAYKRQREALSESNRALFDQVHALEFTKNATDRAYAALEKSIGKEKEQAISIRDSVKSSIDSLKGFFDFLDEKVKSLYGTTNTTQEYLASEANKLIDTSLASHSLPNQDALSSAISTIQQSINPETAVSQFDVDRRNLELAGKLSTFKDILKESIPAAERALAVAQQQVNILDEQLENYKAQIDNIRGVNNSVQGTTTSVYALEAAMRAEMQALLDATKTVSTTISAIEVKPVVNVNVNVSSTSAAVGQSLAVGTNYVPYDGFPAVLHEGESVVPKEFNPLANPYIDTPAKDNSSVQNEALLNRLNDVTLELQRLQGIMRENNKHALRTANATNGRPESNIIVELLS